MDALRAFLRHPSGMTGLVLLIIGAITVLALIGPKINTMWNNLNNAVPATPAATPAGMENYIKVTVTSGAGGDFSTCTGFVADVSPAQPIVNNQSLAYLGQNYDTYANGRGDWLTARKTVGRVHGDGAHGVFTQMLRNFQHQPLAVVVGLKRGEDRRHDHGQATLRHRSGGNGVHGHRATTSTD